MSLLLLGLIVYIAAGLFVIMDMYQDVEDRYPPGFASVEHLSLRQWLLVHLRQVTAGMVIVMLWPLFIAADHASRKRFRMATYVDRDPV